MAIRITSVRISGVLLYASIHKTTSSLNRPTCTYTTMRCADQYSAWWPLISATLLHPPPPTLKDKENVALIKPWRHIGTVVVGRHSLFTTALDGWSQAHAPVALTPRHSPKPEKQHYFLFHVTDPNEAWPNNDQPTMPSTLHICTIIQNLRIWSSIVKQPPVTGQSATFPTLQSIRYTVHMSHKVPIWRRHTPYLVSPHTGRGRCPSSARNRSDRTQHFRLNIEGHYFIWQLSSVNSRQYCIVCAGGRLRLYEKRAERKWRTTVIRLNTDPVFCLLVVGSVINRKLLWLNFGNEITQRSDYTVGRATVRSPARIKIFKMSRVALGPGQPAKNEYKRPPSWVSVTQMCGRARVWAGSWSILQPQCTTLN